MSMVGAQRYFSHPRWKDATSDVIRRTFALKRKIGVQADRANSDLTGDAKIADCIFRQT